MRVMMKLNIPGCVDGLYSIRAKGFLVASFWWADESGALDGWSSFGYCPISPEGNGELRMTGGRAIPPKATHVLVRCISADFRTTDEALFPIPEKYIFTYTAPSSALKFSVMSDLHLSSKPGRVDRMFQAVESDILLLPGDLVNDGTSVQFLALKDCIRKNIPDKTIFSVTGNHDTPYQPLPRIQTDGCDYFSFQDWIRGRAEQKGYVWEQDKSGAYAVRIQNVEVIGLQCVTHWRRFKFGDQRAWLDYHLDESNDLDWHIILCHAPLIAHNPQRRPDSTPYLGKNKELQRIIDGHHNIIFLSGHTHFSPNVPQGCADVDWKNQNIYINDASASPPALNSKETLVPADWKSAIITELVIDGRKITATAKSTYNGNRFPRGYYHWNFDLPDVE